MEADLQLLQLQLAAEAAAADGKGREVGEELRQPSC